MSATQLPPKYASLIKAGQVAPVPVAMYFGSDALVALLESGAQVTAELEGAVDLLRATSCNNVHRAIAGMDVLLSGLSFVADAGERIDQQMTETFGVEWSRRAFAVRSAATSEDSGQSSHAGLYRSVLGVRGLADLQRALLDVWRSFYGTAPVQERVAQPARSEQMGVIVQEMVEARMAGVLFTSDPRGSTQGAMLEWVDGLGDKLVSGTENSHRVLRADVNNCPEQSRRPALQEVFAAGDLLKEHFGCELDIEWAWDGERVFILQSRPITTGKKAASSSAEPAFSYSSLFEADADLSLYQPVPEFARYFANKRSPLFTFAAECGVRSPAGFIFRMNGLWLAQPANQALLAALFGSDRVVFDLSERVRQVIVPVSELARSLLALMVDPQQVHVFTVREFVGGQLGIITMIERPGSILCEYSRDGLLAINRGTAVICGRAHDDQIAQLPVFTDDVARALMATTNHAYPRWGSVQLEWVLDNGRLYLIDFSSLAGRKSHGYESASDGVLSSGYASGPVFSLRDEEALLAELSEAAAVSLNEIPDPAQMGKRFDDIATKMRRLPARPIVLCSKPYAALAALLPFASGFVFENASLLCHLAILLRERGLPAIASEQVFADAISRSHVTVEALSIKSNAMLEVEA